jgi:hypothetical protein
MTVEGTWELTIPTVAGKQHPTLEIAREGDGCRGAAKANDEEMAMEDLVINTNHATWTVP